MAVVMAFLGADLALGAVTLWMFLRWEAMR